MSNKKNNKKFVFLGILAIVVAVFTILYVAGMDDLINWLTTMMILFVRKLAQIINEADGLFLIKVLINSLASETSSNSNSNLAPCIFIVIFISIIFLSINFLSINSITEKFLFVKIVK